MKFLKRFILFAFGWIACIGMHEYADFRGADLYTDAAELGLTHEARETYVGARLPTLPQYLLARPELWKCRIIMTAEECPVPLLLRTFK